MSYLTIGYTRGETPFWAISIVDSTPAPHPYADMLVGSGVHHGAGAPTLEECKDTLLRAALAGKMGIAVTLETHEVALAIAEAHGKDIEGRNHGTEA